MGKIQEQPHGARLQPNCLPPARELIKVWIDPPLTNAQGLSLVRHRALNLRTFPWKNYTRVGLGAQPGTLRGG